jgi:hypothetical protein
MLDKSAEYVGVFTTSATLVRLWPNFWCRKEVFVEVLITEFHEYVSRLSPDFTWKKANTNNVETKVWGFEAVGFECSESNYKNICLRVAYCWQRETAPVILTVQRPPSYQVANLLCKYKLYKSTTSFYILTVISRYLLLRVQVYKSLLNKEAVFSLCLFFTLPLLSWILYIYIYIYIYSSFFYYLTFR